MKLKRVEEWAQSPQKYTLIPLGDIHFGSANCDSGHLQRTIKEIEDNPLARWIGMGDYAEWIVPDDPRWDSAGVDNDVFERPTDLARMVDTYVSRLSAMFQPIIDKCWAFGDGNHEYTINRGKSTNLSLRILEALNAPEKYAGWAALTKVTFRMGKTSRAALYVYHAHGWQAGRTDGAPLNESRRLMSYIDADLYLHGHDHKRWAWPFTRLEASHSFKKLLARDIYVAHTGSFLQTYRQDAVGYGERNEYPPTSLGPVRIEITPGRDGVTMESRT